MTQSATDKLLPCPFCGGEAEICEVGMASGFSFYVSCIDIECQGCHTPLTKYARRSDAIKAWNTRHNPEANALKISVEALRRVSAAYASTSPDAHFLGGVALEALAEIQREAKKQQSTN